MKRMTDILEAMNTIVVNMNDERAYDEWVTVVPDEATPEDYDEVANDQDLRDEAWDMFKHVLYKYGVSGIYWRR